MLVVLLLVSLSQALPLKDNNDNDSDEGYTHLATDIESFHLLPFIRALMTSDEIQWEVMRNWLINEGILKRKQPKKKLQYIRLFWIIVYEETHKTMNLKINHWKFVGKCAPQTWNKIPNQTIFIFIFLCLIGKFYLWVTIHLCMCIFNYHILPQWV